MADTHKCEYADRIIEHHRALFGNGQPGLKDKVNLMWEAHLDRKETMKTIRNSIIALVIANLASFIGWAWFAINAVSKAGGK